MKFFWQVFKFYRKPFRGLFYAPLRWAIVPFSLIESYLPKNGVIYDIGCGEGLMATLLAIASNKREVIGIDLNAKKIQLAKSVAKEITNLDFKLDDVTKYNFRNANGFVLSDFLHHVEVKNHKDLLTHLVKALNSKGIMVIKEIDLSDGFRSKISRFLDFIFYPFEKVSFIDSNDFVDLLIKLGVKVRVIKVKKWFPGSTTLFICQK